MAWRIEEAVTHGEIDNTVEGRTTGRIWLIGRDEPLALDLIGDCWRDLAGTRLRFENPDPQPCEDADALDPDQSGIVGDMTASRKARVALLEDEDPTGHEEEDGVPFEWRNTLYLEWFSEVNGRVVVETADFRMIVSPQEWHMDGDAEDAQKLANLHAMRDFLAQVIRRREPDDKYDRRTDEFAWEERLKESDRLSDAYQEVLEKYMEDPDSDRKEAFVMGWDGLLDAMAERDEGGDAYDDEEFFFEDDDDDDEDDDEEDEDDYFDNIDWNGDRVHPLQRKARELSSRTMDLIGEDDGPGSPSYRLITNLLQVSGKLAGALHDSSGLWEPETGLVLAILKRCLHWLNDAVGACRELMETEPDAARRAALAEIRAGMFEIRNGIVELRRELK